MSREAIAVAITGASGADYGLRLVEVLLQQGKEVHLMLSKPGQLVINMETDTRLPGGCRAIAERLSELYGAEPGQLQVFDKEQWTAPLASGSNPPKGMVICPCTMGTLASVSAGMSASLIERAADVMIKEQKKLILVPRETPFSTLHLENMLRLSRMGVVILPANPGFYHRPQSVEEVIDFIVARILDHLDIPNKLMMRWGEQDRLP